DLEERENARFYEVYLNKLASLLESNAKAGAEGDLPQVGPSNFESRRQKLADILFADLTEKMEGIRSDVLDAFVLAVKKSAGGLVQPGWKDTWENILRRRQLRVSEARDQKFQNPISEELNLTNAAISDKGDGVKSEWLKLKKKIQAVTANAGSKSKLADFLCVDLTQLSKWLTDSDSAREPGADYTLRMQAWVNDPKRQK
ncbi:MAG TPA: hypothetical protein DCQ92_14795, partial [Verrucomicrobia subdivision 3 bacterium]|nr:hypothetical protein [Limisphaerales bacterium]